MGKGDDPVVLARNTFSFAFLISGNGSFIIYSSIMLLMDWLLIFLE